MPEPALLCDFQLKRKRFELNCRLELAHLNKVALYGRSGTGKTSFLRCLAGLESPAGRLVVHGETLMDGAYRMPTHQRRMAYVFQDNRLFPHMTVARQLDWAQELAAFKSFYCMRDAVVHWFALEALLDVYPSALSGGQQRRVALAMALLSKARLLLLDEPLSGLDQQARVDVLSGLRQAQERLALPMIYVTHDPDELNGWVDQVVRIESGKFCFDTASMDTCWQPLELCFDVLRYEPGLQMVEVAWAGQKLWIELPAPWFMKPRLCMRVRNRDIRLGHLDIAPNLLAVQVVAVQPTASGDEYQVQLDVGNHVQMTISVSADNARQLAIWPGCRVGMRFVSWSLME